ncbi:hypothetical protein F4779DRAFT_604138 [Xylariaceae sp. FL0662B]|nr:hypothetical protein F4779DRAFT_604138 [Xylariaceae sp. FL0662B]
MFAAFRKSDRHDDLQQLAEEHLKRDLSQEDRNVLIKSTNRMTSHAVWGTLIGLGLGVYAAYRLRRLRVDTFNAFRLTEKPTHVRFADGRQVAVPDTTPLVQPSRYGDIASYFFYGLGGTVLGGELGLLEGNWLAARTICRDDDRRKRIETAYRRFRADYLKREAARLESEDAPLFP